MKMRPNPMAGRRFPLDPPSTAIRGAANRQRQLSLSFGRGEDGGEKLWTTDGRREEGGEA